MIEFRPWVTHPLTQWAFLTSTVTTLILVITGTLPPPPWRQEPAAEGGIEWRQRVTLYAADGHMIREWTLPESSPVRVYHAGLVEFDFGPRNDPVSVTGTVVVERYDANAPTMDELADRMHAKTMQLIRERQAEKPE